ncbi:hypothetical protein GGR54DRAFT_548180 [Hypoxylon sp. NC1633]|nr:hypothetical protein GGR54DRAFT_548180 [Hypoxylon sp. NC1633]
MVTPACYPPSDAGRRYSFSRACPPYSLPYQDHRRFHLSAQDTRTTTMTERDVDSESSQPRKRIAVACNRCRKRKIRCSGDPGNGHPCSNCKNAGWEPCLFLRVQATETHLRTDGHVFEYNLEAARPYSNQARVTVSQLNSISEYPTDISGGDVMSPYRQHPHYAYSSKGYYPTMSGWTSTYPDDGVDYSMSYPYQLLNADGSSLVHSYGRYGSGKPVYVDPETPSFSYSNLVHRPAVHTESPTGFSLSGMAASLPNPSDRVVPSDRLLPQVNRTLTSTSAYRSDGLPSYSTKTSPTSPLSEVGYGGLSSSFDKFEKFDSPYSHPTTLPSSVSHRSASHHDGGTYASSGTPTPDSMYSSDHPLRSAEDGSSGLSYIYSDTKLDTRRDSQSSGGGSSGPVLPNGHLYVPDSHHSHAHSSTQGYVSSQSSVGEGAAAASSGRGSGSSSSGSSHMHTDGHRRSAGNLRGG